MKSVVGPTSSGLSNPCENKDITIKLLKNASPKVFSVLLDLTLEAQQRVVTVVTGTDAWWDKEGETPGPGPGEATSKQGRVPSAGWRARVGVTSVFHQ